MTCSLDNGITPGKIEVPKPVTKIVEITKLIIFCRMDAEMFRRFCINAKTGFQPQSDIAFGAVEFTLNAFMATFNTSTAGKSCSVKDAVDVTIHYNTLCTIL